MVVIQFEENADMNKKSAKKNDIEAALSSADPKLGKLIKIVMSKIGKPRPPFSKASPFEALLRAIIYQRMAGKAAATIYKRLQLLVKGALTPNRIIALSHDRLRAIGLSDSKAKYARNLSEWFNDNRKTAKNLTAMSNDEVIAAFTRIPGIGVWTANVSLIFNLRRLDVVPASDLGIRRGVQLVYGLKSIATPELVQKNLCAGSHTEASLLCIYGMPSN